MSSKKKLTQVDLRRAMNEAKKKVVAVKKIESPLAKYTDAGQLMCVLCKSIVRSEAIWPVHLNSKNHKENIALAKRSVVESAKQKQIATTVTKRPTSPSGESSANKRVKGILKNAGQVKLPPNQTNNKNSLPPNFFDEDFKHPNPAAASNASKTSEKSEIPRTEAAKDNGSKEAQESNDEAALPEGFFDDPKMDAKVRHVDYKDPNEEEWEKFLKEIKEETAQSAQIIADDQEEATTERQREEIEEQMHNFGRVMNLARRKEQIQASEKKVDSVGEDEASEDDEEYDEFLDWRAKNSYG